VFYYHVWFKKLEYTDLPSFHPYWKEQVKKDVRVILNKTIKLYKICEKDPKQIKYHFNNTTSLNDLKNRITEYKEKLNKHGNKI
jgi:hypothetical protein